MIIHNNNDDDNLSVENGINSLFNLFSFSGQKPFPRKIMTSVTNGTITVNSKEEILRKFKEANYTDCRINAYRHIPVNDNSVLYIPNIIIIDIDIDFEKKSGEKIARQYIKQTLENISYYCLNNSASVLQLFTGNGFHIYVALHKNVITRPLEKIKEYYDIVSEVNIPDLNLDIYPSSISRKFLLYAKEKLSNGKADIKNNPSFKSMLLRVPGSVNSKAHDPINNAIVKEEYSSFFPSDSSITEGSSPKDIALLLSGYRTYLNSLKLACQEKNDFEANRINSNSRKYNNNNRTIHYIETLLQMQIRESRKTAMNIILIPYFVNIQQLSSDADIIEKLKRWLIGCDKIRPIYDSDPKYRFDQAIRYNIRRCRNNKSLKPISFEKLQSTDPELYKLIKIQIEKNKR